MGKGAERFNYKGSPYITDIKDIKVPNWVNTTKLLEKEKRDANSK